MANEDISKKLQNLNLGRIQDINILLLGETGVGKSTFINSIANYLHFKSFKKANKAEELLVLIPSVIIVTNENFEQVTLTIGSDKNEFQEVGAAGTQDVKTYVFPIGEGKTRLRLIDSPGMGDPRGIEQDDINCENILAYLSQLSELHAICFLMKPTTTRKTILFEYCVKQILSRLEKSASKNIIFIFTNTRGSNYTPGDTLPCLKTIVDDIKTKPPHVDIPLKGNIFSVDNEAFRFLVAMKNNIKFNDELQQRFVDSWNKSSEECWKLILYIVGDAAHDPLKPHQLYNTISINDARRIITQLSQPLADISQLIYDNIRILERHKRNLEMENQSLDDLKKKLYIPIVDLEVTQLTQPVTVCTTPKCADVVKVGDIKKWHYRQRCHDPCYLTNVTKEFVGDLNLMHCAAMSGRTCLKCTCDFSVHMHVYYLTKTKDGKIVDDVVKNNINQKEEALRERQRLIGEIDRRKRELEEEREAIIKSTAQFAHFLQHNAISPFNDSYKGYIEYLISREKSLGRSGDPEVVHHLEQLLQRYVELKSAFDQSLQLSQQHGLNTIVSSAVTAQSVMNTVSQLYKLKHNGKKIHELLKKQKASRNSEYDKSCEYVHPKSSDLSHSESSKRKSKKKDGSQSTDTEGNKKEDKKKGNKTDDESKNKNKRYNKNYNSYQRSNNQDQQARQPRQNFSYNQRREPPPPYPGHDVGTYQGSHRPNTHRGDETNLVLKVEVSHPSGSKHQRNSINSNNSQKSNQDQAYYDPSHYQGPPHGPPPSSYYGHGPNEYHGPPPLHHQGYYAPPHGGYVPPQGGYGPPHGGYGPSHGAYGPPPGPYPPMQPPYGALQGSYQGHGYGTHHGPSYQRNYQPGRGRQHFKKNKQGGHRNKSKGRNTQEKKSGNEKSGRSDSDSSSE
ncbi:uncharacterized protein LOC123015565 [Tribolium madens]|uniref:uncharacterized protein LOC123015565 n=1 Tax=Tribolium madens TaxID=41895 RepID=UPI001CF71D84|nr:uncharacterized protein LOC123015565 [Tribolium madens]XP_044271284.1 uncharacterized protein LOC123015565 [Tribolium madens]XP_044271285.1 uncharacterized protein LOC123015565 [Tribolium madens]